MGIATPLTFSKSSRTESSAKFVSTTQPAPRPGIEAAADLEGQPFFGPLEAREAVQRLLRLAELEAAEEREEGRALGVGATERLFEELVKALGRGRGRPGLHGLLEERPAQSGHRGALRVGLEARFGRPHECLELRLLSGAGQTPHDGEELLGLLRRVLESVEPGSFHEVVALLVQKRLDILERRHGGGVQPASVTRFQRRGNP
jgi:hypothetical protein